MKYVIRLTAMQDVAEVGGRDEDIEAGLLVEYGDETHNLPTDPREIGIHRFDYIRVELWLLGHPAWPDGLMVKELRHHET